MIKPGSLLSKILVLLLIILIIGGCWNRRELNTLAIVSGLALDKAEEPGKIRITAQIIKPGEMKVPQAGGGSGGGGDGQKPYWNVSATGDTIFDTIRAITHQSSRKLFFPHNEIVIFSQDVAKEGVQEYLDFLDRDPEPRRLIWILVTKGTASEILETKAELEKVPAISISHLIEARAATSEASAVKMHEFLTRLMSKTTAPVASLIEVSGQGKEKTAILTGTAVFKRDKLVGYLDKTETRGLLWVINEIKSGIIVVECPGGKGKASLEIIRARSKIIPEIKDNKIHITVKVDEEGNLGSQMCSEDLTSLSAWMNLERKQAAAIRSEVKAALKKAQELNTDIFGFGEAVHRKYPKLWKDIEDHWDDFFPDIEVTVIVNAKLRKSGITTKPAKPE
ncbi:MAG: Ger(x)C family spore germination protein [Bacillota bacterium]|uniref:Ger(X)C family spore germination protein n=1 Tax=Thermanaerosceptrum fracticalcis TaxID=1712410 RepID=A0A7G6E351_THEFR|nr:Ger(x)C family spore germination protein [Thermanaerosceptrum fracticalcis]QNB46505.1 Ger(x)C family spore germination protein [Thermanaerosceptrum fracticalcis]